MPGDYEPLRDPVVRTLLRLPSDEMLRRRPELRALVFSRLEMLWAACEPHVSGKDAAGEPMFPDYRYVDLGMRILDRLIRVAEVLKPDPVEPEVIEGRDPAMIKATADLLALEARMRAAAPIGDPVP